MLLELDVVEVLPDNEPEKRKIRRVAGGQIIGLATNVPASDSLGHIGADVKGDVQKR